MDKNGSQEASHGVVCGGRQISLHEVRKEQSKDEDARNMRGPRWLGRDLNRTPKRRSKAYLGAHYMVRRVDPNGESLVWCKKCSGHARCRLGPNLNTAAGQKTRTRQITKHVENNLQTRRGKGARQKRERMEIRRGKKKGHKEKECKRLREEFEVRFHGTKRFVEFRHKENVGKQESVAQRGRTLDQIIQGHA